jgi:hypothetical protein
MAGITGYQGDAQWKSVDIAEVMRISAGKLNSVDFQKFATSDTAGVKQVARGNSDSNVDIDVLLSAGAFITLTPGEIDTLKLISSPGQLPKSISTDRA